MISNNKMISHILNFSKRFFLNLEIFNRKLNISQILEFEIFDVGEDFKDFKFFSYNSIVIYIYLIFHCLYYISIFNIRPDLWYFDIYISLRIIQIDSNFLFESSLYEYLIITILI